MEDENGTGNNKTGTFPYLLTFDEMDVLWSGNDSRDDANGKLLPFPIGDGNRSTSFSLLKQEVHMMVIYTLAYAAVFVLGVVGNTLIVWIVCSKPQMRTVTNYFIVNLAVADILVCLFCLPITLLNNLLSGWSYGAFLCKATPFLQGTSVSASVNTLMAVAFDRYLAICHGMRCHLTRKLARIIIALIWTFAAAVMSPWAVFYQQTLDRYSVGSHLEPRYLCQQQWPSPEIEGIYFLAAIFVTCYSVPLVCITVCYVLIGWKVCNRHSLATQGTVGSGGQTVIQRSKVKVVKMLVTVVVVFAFAWLPIYVLQLRLYFGPSLDYESQEFVWIVQVILPISQWAGSANSCVNPFIYCFFSHKFRAGFKDLLAGRGSACCCDQENLSSVGAPVTTGPGSQFRRRSACRSFSDGPTCAGGLGGTGTASCRRPNGGPVKHYLTAVSSDEHKTSSLSDVVVFTGNSPLRLMSEATAL